MTYAEKYKNCPLCKVLEIFRTKRWKLNDFNLTIQDFLDMEVLEFELKFKVGDLIQVDHNCERAKRAGWNHDVVFRVADSFSYNYLLKMLTPLYLDIDGNEDENHVLSEKIYDKVLIEEICHLY